MLLPADDVRMSYTYYVARARARDLSPNARWQQASQALPMGRPNHIILCRTAQRTHDQRSNKAVGSVWE